MDNASLAARAVANSPSVAAPASFNGQEWLIALNLWAQTAAFLIAAMVIVKLVSDWLRHRHRDAPGISPARVWRINGLLFAIGITLRCGAGALVLWGWNPAEAEKTGDFLFIQRLVDPIAIAFGVSGLIVFVLSLPGMLQQLRQEPITLDIWEAWPIVRRMIAVGVLCFVAAVGVTVTR
jgi:hypothetical protein